MFIATIDGTFAYFLLFAGLSFIIFVHELGHFVVAKAVGIRCTQFAIGFGHALFSWRKGMGLRIKSTEPEYFKRISEYLRSQGQTPQGNAEPAESDASTTDKKTDKKAKPSPPSPPNWSNQQIEQATTALGFGETEYRFNWMPLGGYVKMLGQEDLDVTKVSDDPRSYNSKPVWARMCVISAGVIVNMITAVLFFVLCFMMGVDFPPAIVGDVKPDSPAALTVAQEDANVIGLMPGDHIIAIDGEETSDFNSVILAGALGDPTHQYTFKVERPGYDGQPAKTYTFELKPTDENILGLPSFGIQQTSSTHLAKAENEDAKSLFAKRDVQPQAVLTQVNDSKIDHHWQYTRQVQASNGHPFPVTFTNPDGSTKTMMVKPDTGFQVSEQGPNSEKQIANILGIVPATSIASVTEDAAAKGKLEDRDIVAQINGVHWPDIAAFRSAIKASGSKPVIMKVIREGKEVAVSVTPKKTRLLGLLGPRQLGIGIGYADHAAIVGQTLPDSPFDLQGDKQLPPGTRIDAINGTPVSDFRDIRMATEAATDPTLKVDVTLPIGGGTKDTVQVTLKDKQQQALAKLQWVDPIDLFDIRKDEQKVSSPIAAVGMGIDKTILFLQQTYVTILRLVQGSVKVEHLSGPVGIVNMGQKMAVNGFSYLLFFMGLLSVNLAVLNFLPIPIVDGGHFVLLIAEKLRGKPVSMKIQQALTMVGLAMILALFVTVTYHDIMRLF